MKFFGNLPQINVNNVYIPIVFIENAIEKSNKNNIMFKTLTIAKKSLSSCSKRRY
jgi:hypothetical protein